MKKYVAGVMFAAAVAFSSIATPVYAQDNLLDKIGDSVATMGKSDTEKAMIKSQRQAARAAKRAEKEMSRQAKKMQQGMKNAFGK